MTAKKAVPAASPVTAFFSIGGRRFALTVATQVSNVLLVLFAKISGEVYRDIIIATVAAYIIGNVAQKIKAPGAQNE
jgi:hypothetical protein